MGLLLMDTTVELDTTCSINDGFDMATAMPLPSQNQDSASTSTPSTILQRIAGGDTSAIDECVETYGGLVWSLAKRYCNNPDDAEDATQDIFLELWQKAERFDASRGSESTFIATLARRRLIDFFRRRSSVPDSEPSFDLQSLVGDSTGNPLETQEDAARAMGCFEKLSEKHRSVLGFSIMEGVSHSGIAEKLSLPLGTVKSFARRGLLQLRQCMKRNSSLPETGGAS